MANDELSVVSQAFFAICECFSSPPGTIVSCRSHKLTTVAKRVLEGVAKRVAIIKDTLALFL